MNDKLLSASSVVLVTLLSACSSVSYGSDYDPDIDFATLKTYAWPEDVGNGKQGERGLAELDVKRAKQAVERELAAKGLREVDSAPDLLVNFYLTTEERVDVTTYHDSWGYRGGYGYYGGTRTDVRQWTEGMLVIDLIEAAQNDLAWRGWAQGPVGKINDMTPAERTAAFDEVVAKILAQYPPG